MKTVDKTSGITDKEWLHELVDNYINQVPPKRRELSDLELMCDFSVWLSTPLKWHIIEYDGLYNGDGFLTEEEIKTVLDYQDSTNI